MTNIINDLAKTRGMLIKNLRQQTGLNRTEFCLKYNIPESTQKFWEWGKIQTISTENLQKLINALNNEGVQCTEQYILQGGSELSLKTQLSADNSLDKLYQAEINLFYSLNKNPIHFYLQDNSFSPFLYKGDLIFANIIEFRKSSKYFNKICIIETYKEQRFLKIVNKTNHPDIFTLKSNQIEMEDLILNKSEIKHIAPIVWTHSKFNL